MTGQIPKYGANFTLQSLPYEPGPWASRRYVSKANTAVYIRSTKDSEHWTVFVAGPADAAFPHGEPHDTLTQAMAAALDLVADLDPAAALADPGPKAPEPTVTEALMAEAKRLRSVARTTVTFAATQEIAGMAKGIEWAARYVNCYYHHGGNLPCPDQTATGH
jgi:hypothetical protein